MDRGAGGGFQVENNNSKRKFNDFKRNSSHWLEEDQ